jgi:hypothetical protein
MADAFERYAFFVVLAGVALVAAGYLWLLVKAFRVRTLWGLAVLLVLPALAFVARHFRKSAGPLALMAAGAAVAALPPAYNFYRLRHLDLGPRERVVDGERHVTLTGWDRTDYSVLKSRPDTAVLQMANPDVTDGTLEYLRGMTGLRELDLTDTQVTDAGLAVLKELPNLQDLRLTRTRVTEQGVREQVLTLPNLRRLDVRGLKLPRPLLRNWKNADPQRRDYLLD